MECKKAIRDDKAPRNVQELIEPSSADYPDSYRANAATPAAMAATATPELNLSESAPLPLREVAEGLGPVEVPVLDVEVVVARVVALEIAEASPRLDPSPIIRSRTWQLTWSKKSSLRSW